MTYFFTSESVSEGHPDKLCDIISDSILDATLQHDPQSRVAAETFATSNHITVGGEISTTSNLDIESIVRKAACEVGYTAEDIGLNATTCKFTNFIHRQSPDIAQGVDQGAGLHTAQGAGDQGVMFGYACRQTDELMPLPIILAHRLTKELSLLRKNNILTYLRPDSKSQVTIEYKGNTPVRIDSVVISTQHTEDITHKQLEKDIIDTVIKPLLPEILVDQSTRYYINPTGRFVIGGPHGDAGLTGRKIIVDTYGGWAPHGGGAFSGKDCTKVDRSAAYMARYVAKNLVAAGLADEVEIQLAYAIGVSYPLSVRIRTNGTGQLSDSALTKIVRDEFDLSPSGIISTLNLRRPIYKQTAAYGHFGRHDINLPWESTLKSEELRKYSKQETLVIG